jgi:hypothetical protein
MDSGLGILSLLSAAAGSLTFSPKDSRIVRRVEPVDCIDRGDVIGGCKDGPLYHSRWCIQARAGI